MILLEKWTILTLLQKLPNNVGDLGKIIVATSFEWLPKLQKIAQSGHTDYDQTFCFHGEGAKCSTRGQSYTGSTREH